MLDRAVPVGLVLGVIAVAVAAVRSPDALWEPLQVLHLALVLAGWIVYFIRARLSFRGLVGSLLALAAIDGTANVLTHGLAQNGFLVLACVTVLAVLAFGRRGGSIALAGSAAVWTAAAVLMTSGTREVTRALEIQLFSPWSWTSQILTGVLFVSVVMLATFGTQRRLLRALRDEHQRRQELEVANQALSEHEARRRRAERELADRELLIRLLAENTDDMLFVQDLEMKPVYVGAAAERLFGYPRQELMSMRMEDIMTPESLGRARTLFGQHLARAQDNPTEEISVPLMEFEYVRRDGSKFWGELHVGFLRDEEGKLAGSQGILRDVTDRKKAALEKKRLEEQLRQSEKMRAIGQLAGGIAHDFNNQLTGITMGADLIDRQLPEDAPARRGVGFVQTCAKRASDLTLKLLTFARAGPTAAIPTDVHEVIREVAAILEHSVDKAIALETKLEADDRIVLADAAQLQSALLNIAVNARDAMPSGGVLSFRSEVDELTHARPTASGLEASPGDYLLVHVSDTGSGMNRVMCERIFEPFFTTKPRGQGTGLGLSTAFGALKGVGGAIDVHSEPGHGTTFTLYLPLMQEEPEAEPPPSSTSCTGSGSVLLVDDEKVVRTATAQMLRMLGYDVRPCADGEEALREFDSAETEFDAVVLDMMLPKMSGKDVFEALRARDKKVKILVISGYAPEGEIGSLLDHRGVRFLQKPFSAGDLAEALRLLWHGSQPVPPGG